MCMQLVCIEQNLILYVVLLTLQKHRDLSQFILIKIAAHQCFDDLHDNLSLFLALGNERTHWLKRVLYVNDLIAKELLMRLDAFERKKQQLKAGSVVSDLQILASWQLNDRVQICSDDETHVSFWLLTFRGRHSFWLSGRGTMGT